MGTEHSRVCTTQGNASSPPVSFQQVTIGLQYSATDVAVWPQCVPLVLWFTEQDALVLYQHLQWRTRTRFLNRQEFRAWLTNDSDGTGGLRHLSLPVVPNDIMTPPSVLLHTTNSQKPVQTSTLLFLDLYVDHVFATFAHKSGKLYAMEFLAAMVLGSRAIWRIDDKCRVLLTLFEDPANHSILALDKKEAIYKEADLAQLFLCVLYGVGKLTVGVQRLWLQHGLNLSALARQFASDGIRFAFAKRKDTHLSQGTKLAAMASEVRAYIDATPAFLRFVALFSGEELRNPFTFRPTRSPSDGLVLPPSYRAGLNQQHHRYEILLQQYVSFEGRLARRRESAAMLIQSTWRRRCSIYLLHTKRIAQQHERHASVVRLQSFLRQRQIAKVLDRHADAEVHALNAGVLLAGQGPCMPVPFGEASPSPLRLVDTFKLLHVKIQAIAMSRTCAVALPSDRQSLFVWGRCLPRVYTSSLGKAETITLTQAIPGRLAFRFPSQTRVSQIACGLSHALAVTDDGNVHSWGFNDHGQLGHGSAATLEARTNGLVQYASHYDERDGRVYAFLPEPTKLVYFHGAPQQQADPIPIQTVVCGDYYSLALSRDGEVFSWGEASEGQLGHGDAHARFQVAFVDRYMLNSAYTFLPEPEPVLGLCDRRVVQIACKKNHSVALTDDGCVLEWGNWGKRLGHDKEHAFTPVEKDPGVVLPLRLRQLSVGDHHMIAEGSSVWLTVPGRVDGLSSEKRVYMACSPGWSCDQDTVSQVYTEKPWSCVMIDCDVDNVESEELKDQSTEEADIPKADTNGLWIRRAAPYQLCEPTQLATYDAKLTHVLHCFPSLTPKCSFETMLMQWLHGHVANKLVVMPRGKPPGIYLQILLSQDESAVQSVAQEDAELEPPRAARLPPMVEFPVVASSTAREKVTKRGFASHAFHAVMRERLAPLPRRVQKSMPTAFLEANSIYVIPFDESCCAPTTEDDWDDERGGGDTSERFFTRSATPDGKSVIAWTHRVVENLTRRVLAAQEAGALVVLIVLDMLDAGPFALELAEDSGVYVPVLMATTSTLATRSLDSSPLRLGDVLDRFITAQVFEEPEDLNHPPAVPSPWMMRCFERVDTVPARIQAALANGAAGVILVQDPQSLEVDGETHGAPVFLASPHAHKTTKLVAMISSHDGDLLRSTSRLAVTDRAMPFIASDSPCALVVDNVAIEIRAGGTVYAWGNAQNGRLGLGDPASENGPLRDGYEALTDSAYRFVDRPTPVVGLAGKEMAQLVCGAAHNVAITTEGRVFTWGKGSHGGLATARTKDQATRNTHDQWVPRVLGHLRYDRIVAAAANDSATALLSELMDADVYLERRKEVTQLRHAVRKSLIS